MYQPMKCLPGQFAFHSSNVDPIESMDIKPTANLNKILLDLMKKASKKVEEIQPLLDHINLKVENYRKQRPYDTVTVVGSVGNELYFPEKMSDGSYLVECDVLYSRNMPRIILPVDTPRSGTNIVPPSITVEMDFLNDGPKEHHQITLSTGVCLLHVTSGIEDVKLGNRHTFFKELENKKTYLQSLGFFCFIPEKGEKPGIFGETEIESLEKVRMLPLYRTFRTEIETMNVGEEIIRYRILVDKVAAIKCPWPSDLSDFQWRKKEWPNKELVESIVANGCLLTHNPSLTAFSLQWKMTFSLSEQQITKQFSFYQKYLFILLKLVKKKYLDLGVMENGESRLGLTSYHLKTIYLWVCEARNPEQFEKYPAHGFLGFFTYLKQCIASMKCPHYFIPTLNVMGKIDHFKKPLTDNDEDWLKQHNSIQSTVIRQIDSILHDPEKFLTDDLLEVIDEKHIQELQK